MSTAIAKRVLAIRTTFLPLCTQANQKRGIAQKEHIDPEIVASKPPPFPYDSRYHSYFDHVFWRKDRCVDRWDENTKVICVEGPIAAGKTKFGLELADRLGMRFYGSPVPETVLNHGGFDLMTLNWRLPEPVQYVDMKLFLMKPTHPNAKMMQFDMFHQKYFHYLEGLTHLYNTGQGVIHVRSVWSDFVFFKSLHEMGAGGFGEDVLRYVTESRCESLTDVKRPHLVIYLHVDAEKVLENIRKRNIPHEVNSDLMCMDYIKIMERNHNDWLHEISRHSEVIKYDWTEGGDMDMVVEDLENLDFDQYEGRGYRTQDWRDYREIDFEEYRRTITNDRQEFYCYINQQEYDCPNLNWGLDASLVKEAMIDAAGAWDNYGYNIKHGYGGEKRGLLHLLFKNDPHWRIRRELQYFGHPLRDFWTQMTCVAPETSWWNFEDYKKYVSHLNKDNNMLAWNNSIIHPQLKLN